MEINLKLKARMFAKQILQNYVLPFFYFIFYFRPVCQNRVVFADLHNTVIPFSMKYLHQRLERNAELEIIDFFYKFNGILSIHWFLILVKFMWIYSGAGTIIICDYFFPVASCQKKKQTRVVQLWHSGGLLKKFAYDADDDIPPNYKYNMFKNYDLVTVSSHMCAPVLASAMRMPVEYFVPTGISRTDFYFDIDYNKFCRNSFFQQFPQAQGKKIILWAPTFRGNAANPFLCGVESIIKLQQNLPQGYFFISKVHPHLANQYSEFNCTIPSEELLPVIDVLITDYSSILFDYLLFKKPLVLFAPDLEDYEQKRGFYISYNSLPGKVVQKGEELMEAIISAEENQNKYIQENFLAKHMGCCDGQASKRIEMLLFKSKS